MEEILQIEQACASDNHETVVSMLDSIDSFDLKKQAFLKIIESYGERSIFPTGYLFLFIKWLLEKNDYATAMEYILKCRQAGVAEYRISQLIYETVIKPDEALYKENFNKNINLLQKNKMLISDQLFDFEQIKKQLLIIANCQPPFPESYIKDMSDAGKIPLMIDITDMKSLIKIVDAINFIYLAYDNVHLYYMLLFEDLSLISGYIEQERIVFFDGSDDRPLKDFLSNVSVRIPDIVIGMTHADKYYEIINKAKKSRYDESISILRSINTFYRNFDYQYYRDLFIKDPSRIKILLITSEVTALNKFITKNWHEAFRELGYNSRFLIEKRPFEYLTTHYINKTIHEFKPDLVFVTHAGISTFIEKGEARKNLLWIMRHRDTLANELHHAKRGYEYNNMFILPILFEWTEEMKSIGIPENRIYTTSDGLNINVFTKKDKIDRQYACDIVSVNNAAGSESWRLNNYLGQIKNENFNKTVIEALDRFKETINNEKTIFARPDKKQFIVPLRKKVLVYGIKLNEEAIKYFEGLFENYMDSLCRGRIIEWIIDSGITSNIKLWGKGWSNHEKFKKYHMGVARHGEELTAIYRSSKISISDNPWALHERNFEVFAGGGFPLIRHVKWPEIESPNKITNFFKENEEVVLFYSKDDLLNKIQYFLDNPDERERIAENGRQVVINNFSHVAIARKTMDFIKDYYRD